MGDWVQCSECGNRYDLDAGKFCARCGAMTHVASVAPAAFVALPGRNSAELVGRKRAQLGGVLSTVLGLLFLLGSLGLLFVTLPQSQENLEQVFVSQGNQTLPGGTLHLQVLADGLPAIANVTLTAPGGLVLMDATTVATGWFNVSLPQHAAANLTVVVGNHTLHRRILTLGGNILEVRLDVVRDPSETADRLGVGNLLELVRTATIVVAVSAAVLIAAGIAAVLVRWHLFAMLGTAPILILTAILTVATLNIGLIAVLGLEFVALLLVASGRRSFPTRRFR